MNRLSCAALCGWAVLAAAWVPKAHGASEAPPPELIGTFQSASVAPEDVAAQLPEVLDEAARKFRRTRLRLTAEERQQQDVSFDPLQDILSHRELYESQAVTLSGTAVRLAPATLTGAQDEGRTIYEGVMQVAKSDSGPIRFLVASLPEGMPQGRAVSVPISLTGYIGLAEPAPGGDAVTVLVGVEPYWHRTQIEPAIVAPVLDAAEEGNFVRGIAESERDAYHWLLRHAQLVDYEAQKEAARENLRQRSAGLTEQGQRRMFIDPKTGELRTFVDMFRNPELWRGKLVTLRGHARRAISYPADEQNEFGLETLHEIWLFTDDAQHNPTVVVCTSVPPEMPQGEEISAQIEVTGYFFKKYVYAAGNDSIRVAPLVLAQRVEWLPPPKQASLQAPWYVAIAVAAALALMVGGLWWTSRRDRRARRQRLARTAGEGPGAETPALPG